MGAYLEDVLTSFTRQEAQFQKMIGKDRGERSTKLETSGVMQRTIATMPKPDKKPGINFLSGRKNLLGLLAFGDSLFQQGLVVEYHRRCDGSHQIRQLQLLVQAQLELQPTVFQNHLRFN